MSEDLVGEFVRIKPEKIDSRSDIVTPQKTQIIEVSAGSSFSKPKYKVNVEVAFESDSLWTTWLYRDQFEIIEER